MTEKLKKAFDLISIAFLQANFPHGMSGIYSYAENIEEEDYIGIYGQEDGWQGRIVFGQEDEHHKDEYNTTVFMSEKNFDEWEKKGDENLFPIFIDLNH